eukprot:SAG31_NODE_897_length_11148_cov_15.102815_6_plen_67_part_00
MLQIGWVFLILVEGAVAGVMSALMISMQGEDQEYHDSIRSARAWLKEQKQVSTFVHQRLFWINWSK